MRNKFEELLEVASFLQLGCEFIVVNVQEEMAFEGSIGRRSSSDPSLLLPSFALGYVSRKRGVRNLSHFRNWEAAAVQVSVSLWVVSHCNLTRRMACTECLLKEQKEGLHDQRRTQHGGHSK